jgi:signal peptidase I
MLPRLEDRDRLFINKFVYHISAIERGDVVVFHYPRDPEKSYIKRVIALPGDRLRIDHGKSGSTASGSLRIMFPRSTATAAPWPRWWFPRTLIS